MDESPARSMPHVRNCRCGAAALVTLHGEPLCGKHALERMRAERAEQLNA